ncbi:flippase-like domain-containing protein [Candidatus Woesearchaeota archaeon]|nr:flippase-like domain-containing protein [Candidatus Woesearchaeota archaeon]
MNKRLALTLSLIIGLAAAIITFEKVGLQEAFNTMAGATLRLVGAYAAITLLIMLALVWRWRVIIKAQHGATPSFWELCRYYFIGYAVSYVTPGAKMGGEVFRAGLLSRHCSLQKASSTVFIDKTIELTASGTFFIIGAAVLLLAHITPEGATGMMIITSIILLVLIGLFYAQMFSGKDLNTKLFKLLRLHRTKQGKQWVKHIQEYDEHITRFYKQDRKKFFAAVLISLLSWALMFVEYGIVLAILGHPATSILELFLIITFIGAAYLIPIPMALGTLEAGQAGIFKMIGLGASTGIGVALITRLKDIILSLAGFTAMSFHWLHHGKEGLPFRKTRK